MKNTFKFVYSIAEGECPDAVCLKGNNITNAKKRWEDWKKRNDDEDMNHELLAIYDNNDRLIWKGRETGFQLELVG